MTHTIYLALGSNLGDRLSNLETAIQSMPPGILVLKRSSIYETPPWGFEDQPAFLNMVLQAETQFSPWKLLKFLKALESGMGRQPSFRNGPRLIDLDILFYDQLVSEQSGLVIPHARIAERAFVLVPLAEIAPGWMHPVLQVTIQELLAGVESQGINVYAA
ncbi:MAG: 2-amino-4-hydroxy-6-hydroxymethyldihydropteridine diphosphokinase [Chloroflexi bacterium GWB2_49_20]|nr:MAG: 2-amino-4-hydroxy-6-hydroxymethyldihydropteridine diphosphokinase [Chloroflexi bacterium GWB2_49_20]OGN77925.1 MAG: 2-amino-4-hydroxy-6-hydroxymethyldihydropteridine diphosphokinase [Chloroflexi bacterium GWC2_49_37]OGN84963.1 MAG: 2-amino-4-hydroxy-6-hydroxymethyldihydropteridine diphosphokinase [Chloroflexi bacterium GWD2_49_16]HBG75008.1 2-amino-4-hydroxy-6-hydroxymethyldihydropteridine diphosphokinase [Anaerolineae bacterium]HCC79757.1 2-amino-4-hydroxy-6-hydroxymethyldihydropteridi